MRKIMPISVALLATFAAPALLHAEPKDVSIDAAALYAEHCASCHGPDRLGSVGPALLPGNLGRMTPAKAATVIANGRPATKMTGFSALLSPEQIQALSDWIFRLPAQTPVWGDAQIAASHTILADQNALASKPPFASDPLNLFIVVETGDHHVTILDGDRMEPLYRLPSRFALHGGAKFSPDGRFVFLMSRDGWVSKIDLWTGTLLAEVRAGINSRNIAVSDDGRYVLVGNLLPETLVMLDARDLALRKVIPVVDGHGQESRVSAVYTAPPRKSFLVALKDAKEMWEIPYGEDGVAGGFARNMNKPADFPIRRIALSDGLDDFFFDQSYRHVIGAGHSGNPGRVVDINTGHDVATLPLSGMPHLGSGITFLWHGRPMMAAPHLQEGIVSVVDMTDWREVKRIPTCGPGFFLRSHPNSRYAWVDCSLGKNRDTLDIIDLDNLDVTRTVTPMPGKAAAHVEFSRDGRFALVSVMEKEGALVIYDARSFTETKRLPMSHPVGKYNVFNKISYSAGTSH